MGDAIRTAGSFENQMKKLSAVILTASTDFGKELNVTILKTIEEMGGLDTVLALVKLAFKGVAEAGKLVVRVLGSYVDATGKAVGGSEDLESSLLGIEDFFRRIEIAVRTFLIPFGIVATVLTAVIGGVILLGQVLFFVGSVVLKTIIAAFNEFSSIAVGALADITLGLAFLTAALGQDRISKSLGSATKSLRDMQNGMHDLANDALPSIKDLEDGFSGLENTAKAVGSAIADAFDIGVVSQIKGIGAAADAIGVIGVKKEREGRKRERAAKPQTAAEKLEAARKEIEGQGRIFISGETTDVTGRFNRQGAAVAANVSAAGPTTNINESNVEVTIGEIIISTAEAVKDPAEAARIIAEEVQRQIRTGQVEPFAEGPR
jgi:hypothetical protein